MAALNFRANALRLAQGTVFSQVLLVAATPALTRLYSPANFGDLAVFSSLYSILGAISALKFDQAIFLPKSERVARDLTRLMIVLASSLALLVLLVVAVALALHVEKVGWFFLLLPLTLVTGVLQNIWQLWCSRQKTFRFYAQSAVINSFCNITVCFALYRTGLGAAALVMGYVAGICCAAAYLLFRKWRLTSRLLHERRRRFFHLFLQYKEFPLYVLPNVVMTTLGYQVMPILITHYFDSSTTGFFSIANRMMVLPSILIGSAVGEVFRSEFVGRLHAEIGYRDFFDKILLRLLALGAVAYAAAWLVSPFLFRLVFGEKYGPAGIYAQYLCLGMAGLFVAQPFSYVFIALGKARAGLILQSLAMLASVAGFWAGAVRHDVASALQFSSAGTFVGAILMIGFAYSYVHARSAT